MTAAQLSVEAVARRLCLAAGQEPDQAIYIAAPEQINTPLGAVHAPGGASAPLWCCYGLMASAIIDDIAAGRLG